MNRWLKIGAVAVILVISAMALGTVTYSLLPVDAQAQFKTEVMQRTMGVNSPEQFGKSPFGQEQGQQFSGRGGPGGMMKDPSLLATELGVTVAELSTARNEARIKVVQNAVTAGTITQEQADQMLLGGGKGGSRGDVPRGALGGREAYETLLAAELNVTAPELQAAQMKAQIAGVEKALAEGLLTQSQADDILGNIKFRNYVDKEAMAAGVLGITVEELKAARSSGKTRVELVNELGLDAATVRRSFLKAHQAAVQQAVTDGIITQEQADQIMSKPLLGGRGGQGGHGRQGGPDGGGHGPGGGGSHGPGGGK